VNAAWVSAIVALTMAVGVVIIWMLRLLWRLFRKSESFLEDWNGKPPFPGHPAQPGVIERLATLENNHQDLVEQLSAQNTTLEQIKDEVSFNHGHSLKDAVRDIQIQMKKMQLYDEK
jgi:hypothetical protein